MAQVPDSVSPSCAPARPNRRRAGPTSPLALATHSSRPGSCRRLRPGESSRGVAQGDRVSCSLMRHLLFLAISAISLLRGIPLSQAWSDLYREILRAPREFFLGLTILLLIIEVIAVGLALLLTAWAPERTKASGQLRAQHANRLAPHHGRRRRLFVSDRLRGHLRATDAFLLLCQLLAWYDRALVISASAR